MALDDRDIESLLRRWRPVGPPDGLRRRVLGSASREVPSAARRSVIRWAAAAALLVAVALQGATLSEERDIRAMLGEPRVLWTAEVEALARAIDGDGNGPGRRYLAMQLAWRPPPDMGAWPALPIAYEELP